MEMPSVGPVIETERLVLRLPRHGDEVALPRFFLENRDFLQPWSPPLAAELFTEHGWRARIEATWAEYRAGRGLRLIMLSRTDSDRVLGTVNFTSITGMPTCTCTLGYSLAEIEQRKGYMSEALAPAIEYVFGALGLHRIEANYMPRNVRSARLLRRLGFAVEGRSPGYILIAGKWEDHVRTALLNPNWPQ